MRKHLSILLALTLFISCESNRSADPSGPENVPNALNPKQDFLSANYGRTSADLVADLYKELAKTDKDVQQIEKQLSALRSYTSDSLAAYYKFSSNNNSYYSAAKSYSSKIKDSSLRVRMDTLIARSQHKYDRQVKSFTDIQKAIDNNDTTLLDLHAAYMLIKSLPMIEQYQKNDIPSFEPFKEHRIKQEKAINNLKSRVPQGK